MKKRRLAILGSTGSIGTQALEVAALHPDRFEVAALTAYSSREKLFEQVRAFRPRLAGLVQPIPREEIPADLRFCEWVFGPEALTLAAQADADDVLVSVVGMVGLKSVLTALAGGKRVLLANKEALVAGGDLVMERARALNRLLLPVDSEHSAIFQSLVGEGDNEISKLLLTCSGGPFRKFTHEQLRHVTAADALRHPTWDMGAKITIDCATMMNKGLEIMEASWLFDMPIDRVDVVVHRESIIHSMVQFQDNSVLAQLGVPDMRIPIQYALTYPKRLRSPVKELDLTELGALTFFPPDEENFLCLKACKQAMILGGTAPAAANGANEQAVELFLQKKISFLEIGKMVAMAIERQADRELTKLEDILKADRDAREFVLREAD